MTPVTSELNYYEGSFVKNIYIKAILFIHIYICVYIILDMSPANKLNYPLIHSSDYPSVVTQTFCP